MAPAELSFLLFTLINTIHAEELITIRKERDSYAFNLTEQADFCLISRLVGEEKHVLWNTSDLWSKNSTVLKDLKKRLSVASMFNNFSYMIHNLTHSDSGRYQEKCWTKDKVTYEKNIWIAVCGTIDEIKSIPVKLGEEADLPCEGAADNLDIKWLKREFRYKKDIWTRVFGDRTTLVMDSVKGRFQVVNTTSALRVTNFTIRVHTLYMCLVMNQQQCVSSHPVQLFIVPEIIYHSVEEAAVLHCTVADFSDEQPPFWAKLNSETKSYMEVGQNYTLTFPSLTLNDSGWYFCENFTDVQSYLLVVCPTFDPPVVEFFSEGDEVTLRFGDFGEEMLHFWFIKSNQTDGRVFSVFGGMSDLSLSRVSVHRNKSLVISNASQEHTGEYWSAVVRYSDERCVSMTKTLLKYREPFDIDSTVDRVRVSLLIGLLIVLCATVVAVIQKTRTRRE